MTPLRSLLAGAALLALTPNLAAAQSQQCLQPAEQQHFQVRALQSQLMVLAISCERHDDYNRFVTQFQPQLAAAFRGVQGHFRRVAGSQHQRQTDQYITNLANGQSQVGISQGTFFCRNQQGLFAEALAAPNVAALAQISVAREVPQTYSLPTCTAPAPRQQRAQGR
ncbi:hypothetical protein ACI6QG_08665 [Roseococcus sp. DSY-14]|uniref:hypothetical protein n=1 Tax=Roseococcus sp. DSY-14 TaxID=3369650 RepID=UPI00387B08CF